MDMYEVLMQRRSIRNFSDQTIPPEILHKLLDAAITAPSGGNIQPVSIILVQEKENRDKLAKIVGGQPWVMNAPLSMIFCLDFFRVKRWATLNNTEFKGERALSHFLIAYADLMCAAQAVALLAESYGLGSVYVGTIQSNINEAREAFAIPEYVLPLMVLSLGYPKSKPRAIPKLRQEAMVHSERYQRPNDDEIRESFDTKYGKFNAESERYLEKAFVETIEAEKQGVAGLTSRVRQEMQKLEIKNDAEFLFKLRYPADVMVMYNQKILHSFKNAGFDFWSKDPTETIEM